MAQKKTQKKVVGTDKSKQESPELKRLRSIFELMNESGISELEWHKGSEKIIARTPFASGGHSQKGPGMPSQSMMNLVQVPQVESSHSVLHSPAEPKPVVEKNKNLKEVCSPLVGTFYSSPSPQSEAYVKVGQSVSKGDVLCIVEAMKLMNEIESEFKGKIVSVLVENGQPVEYGEPLYVIDVSA